MRKRTTKMSAGSGRLLVRNHAFWLVLDADTGIEFLIEAVHVQLDLLYVLVLFFGAQGLEYTKMKQVHQPFQFVHVLPQEKIGFALVESP